MAMLHNSHNSHQNRAKINVQVNTISTLNTEERLRSGMYLLANLCGRSGISWRCLIISLEIIEHTHCEHILFHFLSYAKESIALINCHICTLIPDIHLSESTLIRQMFHLRFHNRYSQSLLPNEDSREEKPVSAHFPD